MEAPAVSKLSYNSTLVELREWYGNVKAALMAKYKQNKVKILGSLAVFIFIMGFVIYVITLYHKKPLICSATSHYQRFQKKCIPNACSCPGGVVSKCCFRHGSIACDRCHIYHDQRPSERDIQPYYDRYIDAPPGKWAVNFTMEPVPVFDSTCQQSRFQEERMQCVYVLKRELTT